ncbi:MAG: transposase [Syntrophotaleaceae bacterium]
MNSMRIASSDGDFAAHDTVSHGQKEFARGLVHNNTAESYNALLERAKQGVYHWMSRAICLFTSLRRLGAGTNASR